MERNLMIAGFGGQGVMLMGKLLSYACFKNSGKNVTFFPSYGAEQRGGTANCYVVISDKEIGAPLGDEIDELIVMSAPSLNKFLYKLVPGGTLFINSSIVKADLNSIRRDIGIVSAPVTELAIELGNIKVLNTVMLGVYIGYTGAINAGEMMDTIEKQLAGKPDLIGINRLAFSKGFKLGLAERPQS